MNIKDFFDNARCLSLAALCLGAAGSAQALSLAVEHGEIMGLLGVEIQGRLYDVTFADGSFNGLYPAEPSGYGPLAQDAAQALLAASESGALHADPNWKQGLRLHGCASGQSCTILIPDHSLGEAPAASTTHAREVIYSNEQFRSVTAKLWPFDASTDTRHMPDMLFAILTPAR